MRVPKLAVATAAAALVVGGTFAYTASATPPSVPGPSPTPSPPPAATLAGPLRASADGIRFEIRDDALVRNFRLVYPPKSNSGWHIHPGIVMATVESGDGGVMRTLGCGPRQKFEPGQAFVEVGPHLVENDSDSTVALIITQIVPAGTTVFTDAKIPEPTCRPRHRH